MSGLRLRLAVVGAALVALAGAGGANAASTELYFSEYIEGSSNNKALEIYNGTGAPIDLAANGYSVQMCFNGATTCSLTINLTGTVASGDVFVLAQSAASAAILAQADQTNGSGWFNGDDAVALRKGTTVIDSFGVRGVDPGTEWGSGLTSTADNTLRRQSSITAGDPIDDDAFDPAAEWDGFATDTFDGLGTHTTDDDGDAAPSVLSTTPANGAAGVARDANVSVTFSEPVSVAGSWFSISCATSGPHAAAVSGGATTFTLDPASNFAANELCTVTLSGANVSDADTEDPPNEMAADHTFSFQTVDTSVCGDPATRIHAIQGDGAATSKGGETHSIEGVVVGDYQLTPSQFNGFYMQEEDGDADGNPATSEGIFVFRGGVDVDPGDVVRVRGVVSEFGTVTQLSPPASGGVLLCSEDATVTPASLSLPVFSNGEFERVEGMLVHFAQTLTATEVFSLGRFGEVSLSGAGRLYNPTAVAAPGAPAQAVGEQNDRSRIVLDDANNQQNIDPTFYPLGGLSATNTLRVGDTLPSLTGVMDFRFSLYRIQPVGPLDFTESNPRPEAPAEVGGNLKVASFNVLNYFNGDGMGGGFPTSRGAINAFELERQEAKIVSALTAIDADVVGLMEIENDEGATSALAQLVAALNEATAPGTYAAIDTGVIGTDEIAVALIYKPAAATPVGDWEILTSADDPRFDDTRSRPALAQTFLDLGSGQKLTVVVNHLKSKGSGCGGAPDDQPDEGGGNCNGTRTLAAAALADWLAGDPTGSGDPDFAIIGDLNSYTFETPISTLEAGGFMNLVRQFNGLDAYSYVFMGESGYLDHALATSSLAGQVTGTTIWHINPDEPTVLDYTTEFKSDNHVQTLYDDGPYRASDHDPVIVGVQLDVTFASLCTLTQHHVTNKGIADALCSKLAAAEAAEARGDEEAKRGSLGAYVNQLEAQAGKALTAEAAAHLAALAATL
ncbi:MAG TPA: ExeM/NucH family extracellular endonuclease [Gaiellaceae bacterium]|nr:ExeM/NucH family extracellular endonuclease [Gaiellaceae bacterium]